MPLAILVVDDETLVEKMIRSRFRKEIKAAEFAFHFALGIGHTYDKLSWLSTT